MGGTWIDAGTGGGDDVQIAIAVKVPGSQTEGSGVALQFRGRDGKIPFPVAKVEDYFSFVGRVHCYIQMPIVVEVS